MSGTDYIEKMESNVVEMKSLRPQKSLGRTRGGGDNGGMDLTDHRLTELERRAERTEAKLDKLVETIHGLDKSVIAASSGLGGRLDLIEKKLPNWWQPYVGIGALGATFALLAHFL
ncbi:hypothetical protein AA12717_1955 [Gluconacetobacter sacchari DSM 12717]|uniref:Uncharacterized protein n=2 Tax=Gluconacetobacter sacchari TaxID=92759 RepID=A0A7W4NRF7_9PROT|nr:hypothetical protein [Gluconacetobacter sacchari]MBB2160125.1 hypothetical protein [Gluconacetobacter sacchari]GBQ25023.1 hypothetical protein AA12717_1955 [Gluconacetobacter sacchari DSM 12717]